MMVNISNTFFKKLNLYAVTFLVTFGLLLQISASSVQGLNQFGDNFYFIKRHLASLVIGSVKRKILKALLPLPSPNLYRKNNISPRPPQDSLFGTILIIKSSAAWT